MRAGLAVIAIAVAAALGAIAAGRWITATGAVTVTGPTLVGEAAGTVTILNSSGTAICLAPEGGGEPLCSGLWLSSGQILPAVGESIRVWIVRVPLRDRIVADQLILKPPPAGN